MNKPELKIELNRTLWAELTKRPAKAQNDLQTTVAEVFNEVQAKGDTALRAYTQNLMGQLLKNYW